MNKTQIKELFLTHSLKISLALIIGGFIIMAIGNKLDNSFIQLTLSPILLLIGYSLVIFAIMNKKKQ